MCLGKWHLVLTASGGCMGGVGIPVGDIFCFPVILLINRSFACFRGFHVLRTQRQHCLQFITPWHGARFLTGACGMTDPNSLLVSGVTPLWEGHFDGHQGWALLPNLQSPTGRARRGEGLPMCCSAPSLGKPWVSFWLPQNTSPAKLTQREKSGSLWVSGEGKQHLGLWESDII